MTIEIKFDGFLKFHSKKGVESGGVVMLRSSSIENMKKLNQPLIYTAEGQEGFMALYPDDVEMYIASQSKQTYGNSGYHLCALNWDTETHKIRLTRTAFLDYFISDKDDVIYWGNRFIRELKADGDLHISAEDLLMETEHIPGYVFGLKSDEDIPTEFITLVKE